MAKKNGSNKVKEHIMHISRDLEHSKRVIPSHANDASLNVSPNDCIFDFWFTDPEASRNDYNNKKTETLSIHVAKVAMPTEVTELFLRAALQAIETNKAKYGKK